MMMIMTMIYLYDIFLKSRLTMGITHATDRVELDYSFNNDEIYLQCKLYTKVIGGWIGGFGQVDNWMNGGGR